MPAGIHRFLCPIGVTVDVALLVGIVDEIPCVVFIDWLSAKANDGRDITEASEGRTPFGSIITAVAGAVLLIDEQESLLFQANCDVNVILS